MSSDPPYDQKTLNEISELFSEAEKAIKYIEDFGGELVFPAVNQLRYTGNHLVRYLSSLDGDELRDAGKHAKRAAYDAYEAAMVYHLLEYNKFCNDYRKVQISTVIPEYIQYKEKIEAARKYIRANSESISRGDNYRNGKEHLDQIVCAVKLFNASREELNKLIKKELLNLFLQVAGVIAAAIGAIGTVVSIIAYIVCK